MDITPAGYTTVAPWIVTDDTRALLRFVADVFDGVELGTVPLQDGSIGHAEIRIEDTVLLAFDRRAGWPQLPSLLRVFVADADVTIEAAIAARATLVTAPATHAFGQRVGRIRDPFGNIWWITANVDAVDPTEGMRRLNEPHYADAMRDAQQTLDRALGGTSASSPVD